MRGRMRGIGCPTVFGRSHATARHGTALVDSCCARRLRCRVDRREWLGLVGLPVSALLCSAAGGCAGWLSQRCCAFRAPVGTFAAGRASRGAEGAAGTAFPASAARRMKSKQSKAKQSPAASAHRRQTGCPLGSRHAVCTYTMPRAATREHAPHKLVASQAKPRRTVERR